MRYCSVLFGILWLCLAANRLQAQSDPFGQPDVIYLDSVEAVQGQSVQVRCLLKNDEFVSIVSVPLTYDTARLTLTAVSFDSSRAGYLQTKVVTPQDITQAGGHLEVALIKMSEQPLPPGDGLLFTLKFTVKPVTQPVSLVTIDSLFFPPGGELLLTENASALGIRPIFRAGKVLIRQENLAPVIAATSPLSVFEGDTLKFGVSASDPEGSPVTLACVSAPTGAIFTPTRTATGQFRWVPDFTGPLSADKSPFTIAFRAFDGFQATVREVTVNVINRNRPPVIEAPASVTVTAGDDLGFDVRATDPDFDAVTVTVSGNPSGSLLAPANPAHFSWLPPVAAQADTVPLRLVATDPHGFADTAVVVMHVQAATLYDLSLDTASVYPGDQVAYDINLDNKLPVAGFDLLINYDVTGMAAQSVTNAVTRAAGFEYFSATLNAGGVNGNIRILGTASNSGASVSPLPAGVGPIARVTFRAVADYGFVGVSVPVRFVYADPVNPADNTLTDTTGAHVPANEVAYHDGYVFVTEMGDVRIGDINLNNIAFEISDVVYFTNYFINPSNYPLNALQYANSDVNQDDIVASVADLVKLISVVVHGGPTPGKVSPGAPASATYAGRVTTDGAAFDYRTDFPVGGVLLALNTNEPVAESRVRCANDQMTVAVSSDGPLTRILIYSLTGQTLAAGAREFLSIQGLKNYTVASIEMATADGRTVAVSKDASLPAGYRLEQNYPNPFNPTTRIAFSLPQAGSVELSVYDVLGRRVATLASGQLPAGDHAVTWDGRDERGASVASGIYFYRLTAGGATVTRKMMLVK